MTDPTPVRTALVTGAAGFIGSHLSRRLLEEGWRVVGLDNFDAFYPRPVKEANIAALPAGFEFCESDLVEPGVVESLVSQHRPEIIVHLAALAGVRPSLADPARYAHVNVTGLVRVLEAARQADGVAVLFASSSSVYGNRASGPFAEKDDAMAPVSPYAATKRAGELMCGTYAHLYDMRIASLRFFTVFGPGQRPDLAIAKFMQLMAKGQPIQVFGDGSSSRDYTYIGDIIDGVRSAMAWVGASERGRHRVFNLGGAHPVTLSALVDAVADVVGVTPKIERHPLQPGDVACTFADLTRSAAELDYRPTVAFEEGLRRQWDAAQR